MQEDINSKSLFTYRFGIQNQQQTDNVLNKVRLIVLLDTEIYIAHISIGLFSGLQSWQYRPNDTPDAEIRV